MTLSNKTYYIFRHGLATHSKYGYGKAIITAHILPEGIPAIKKIGEWLSTVPDSLNVSSEFIRCKETSDIVSAISGKQFARDSRLNEKHNETIPEVRERVKSLLDELESQSKHHIVICTHGTIIAALKNLLLLNTFVTKMHYDYPQPGVLLIIEGNTVKTINFN